MATFVKRVSAQSEVSWLVRVRRKGAPPLTNTFKYKRDAEAWARKVESEIERGIHVPAPQSAKRTLADLLDRYIAEILPKKRRQRATQIKQLHWWRAELGAYLLNNVTPEMIGACRDKLLTETTCRGQLRSGATVNRYLAALSHAYSVAVKEWGWLEASPLRRVTKEVESRGRVRFLSDDERLRLLTECRRARNPYLYTVVVLALSTGARAGELLGLTWDTVDLRSGRLTFADTKNGERRAVTVSGHALELLEAHARVRRIDSRLLFPSLKGDKPLEMRAAFVAAVKRAKIENFRFHDLRHSAASYLAMGGATLPELAEILGHKTLQMVKRYAHLSDEHTAKVLKRLDEQLFGNG
jgi:integrase